MDINNQQIPVERIPTQQPLTKENAVNNLPKNNKPNLLVLTSLGIISCILLIGVFSFVLGFHRSKEQTFSALPIATPSTATTSLIINSPSPTNRLIPTQLITSKAVPTSILCQKTYHSNGGHFSICVPNNWEVSQYGNAAEDANTINMDITPANEPGIPSESLTIYSQDAAPGTWEQLVNQFASYTKNNWFLNTKSYATQIAEYPAQAQRYVWKPSPPPGFAGEWSDSTEKIFSINIGNNKQYLRQK